MRSDVRNSGKRPRDAFTSMMSSVGKKFKSSEVQAAIVAHLPAYGEVRHQLSRQRTVQCTPVPDPLDIPDVLRVTLRGRQVDESDSNFNEPFLMSRRQTADLLRTDGTGRYSSKSVPQLRRNFRDVTCRRVSGIANCLLSEQIL